MGRKTLFSLVLIIALLASMFWMPGPAQARVIAQQNTLTYPYGPNLEQFPEGVNPLTGLPVADPSWLDLPALLVSISNFPPTVRPQTGLSFAAQVYEIYITEGMTRFLTVFYGEAPRVIPQLPDTTPRNEPLKVNNLTLGSRVWWDENGDGLRQSWEAGLGGIEIQLLDSNGSLLEKTVTDPNGFYGFAAALNRSYRLKIQLPEGLKLTKPNVGDEAIDSDADPKTGLTELFRLTSAKLDVDFGLLWQPLTSSESPTPTPPASLQNIEQPGEAGISGVRSGREAYVPIVNAFPNGCLVAASKSADVNVRICKNVVGSGDNVNNHGITFSQMRRVAEANRDPKRPPNYSGNVFDPQPPQGGKPARQVNVFYAYLNQSQWIYDPLAGGYWRYQDNGSEKDAGKFSPAVDRLTGRPLIFENIIILFVEHTAKTSTIIDLNMPPGSKGKAIVFRNGQVYTNLQWSLIGEEYEKQTGMMRPLRIRYADGTPFPLAPGQTWLHVATLNSAVWEVSSGSGVWKYRYYPPPGTR